MTGSISVSRKIDASAERVWDLITDTKRWPEWGPSVRAVECSERRIRQHSQGRVQTALGFWAPFVVTEFVAEHYWAWQVFSVRATGHRVEPLDQCCCKLSFDMPLAAAPYGLICRLALARIAGLVED